MTQPIFTRYLYLKSEVEHSLLYSILSQDQDQSLFWGYELYHSGFKLEVLAILSNIYNIYYYEYSNLGIFLNKKCCEFAESTINQECILGIIIRNLTVKPYPYNGNDRKLFIILEESNILKYRTVTHMFENLPIKPHHILKNVCKYTPFREPIHFENQEPIQNKQYINITKKYYTHWLYYASFSPIWRDRIGENGGTINDLLWSVDFINDDKFDQFYELYNYEPDEQSVEIQQKHILIK